MAFGMALGRIAPPRPPSPAFSRIIPTTISPREGKVVIQFYTPRNYKAVRARRKLGSFFPVVVNFHGGGFTLGSATDDARWAGCVVERTGAVVASVDYRLAPEFPFPTAVEDGVDAVLYIARCATDLWLDADRIAISGFSCGGNMAFTVPLRLKEELDPALEGEGYVQAVQEGIHHHHGGEAKAKHEGAHKLKNKLISRHGLARLRSGIKEGGIAYTPGSVDGSAGNPAEALGSVEITGNAASMSVQRQRTLHPSKGSLSPVTTDREVPETSDPSSDDQPLIHLRIPAIIAWYPSTDYTLTRDQRRETLVRKDMELNPVFTTLFDASYIEVPTGERIVRSNPFLSPGVAPEALLANALPDNIIMITCEWDMLRAEGTSLKSRLEALGKTVVYRMVEGVPHGWDKSPNPFKEARRAREYYNEACTELRRILGT